MSSAWQSFVPRHVLSEIAQHPRRNPVGREQRLQCVALFADVSGFTAISEALAVFGTHGTEELTTILNSYFQPMIDLIETFGGIIGKFGGDAMTVLFPCNAATQRETVRRAIQCAVDMQAAMPRYHAMNTSAGEFSLAMKAGLALGEVLCLNVGDPAIRLEYIIAGNVLDVCADAEHHASKGEIVVSNDLLAHADDALIIEQRGAFSCIAALATPADPAPLPTIAQPTKRTIKTIAAFLHPALVARIQAGQIRFINEHRRVVVLFVRFGGFDYDHDPHVGAALQRYANAVIQIVDRYDGYLNKIDMGDKGSKYIVVFGAPVAHENDAERALRCALELRDLAPSTTHIGMNLGVVFCGQVGSDARQEYTVMGDPVNLAARLMQAAQAAQIVASSAIYHAASEHFIWQALAPITVKGKTEPIEIFALADVQHSSTIGLSEPVYHLPMVGRVAEREQAATMLNRARQQHGTLIGITAEAGMGKSRLGAAVVDDARQAGFAIYGGACQSFGSQNAYVVWHNIWRGFFGLPPDAALGSATSQLASSLRQIAPRLVEQLPLLGPLMNLAIPDNALTARLDGQLRNEMLRTMVLTCLQRRAEQQPIVLLLEDIHWIDPVSLDLLEFIARNLAQLRLSIVVLYRPLDDPHHQIERLMRLPFAREIALHELDPAETTSLIQAKLQHLGTATAIDPALLQRISERAAGNPFYIEELTNYLHERGIQLDDAAAADALDLPSSLQSLIISRIDQLNEVQKTTLKVASVLGRVFKAAWIWGSYPDVGLPEDVKTNLQTLNRLDITPLDKPEPELEYVFKHITTQEVAYESMAFALRAELHEAVAHFIERTYADETAQYVNTLAFHYGRTTNLPKQQVYFRQAADAAKASFANALAIEYYQRLLPLVAASEQAAVLRDLAEVQQFVGQWQAAETNYRQSLAIACDIGNTHEIAATQTLFGRLLARTSTPAQAIEQLEQARKLYQANGDQHGLMKTLEHLGYVYGQQSMYDQAFAVAHEHLKIAQDLHDEYGQCTAAHNLGVLCLQQGQFSQAQPYLETALNIAHNNSLWKNEITILNDLAGMFWFQKNTHQAFVFLQQALEIAVEIGHQETTGYILGNVGVLYHQNSEFERALQCYLSSLLIDITLGSLPSISRVIINIGIVFLDMHHYQKATDYLETASKLTHQLDMPYRECAALYYAGLAYHDDQPKRAISYCQQALSIAQTIQRRDIEYQAAALLVELSWHTEQTPLHAALDQLDQLAADTINQVEQATFLYHRWRISQTNHDRDQVIERYRQLYAHEQNHLYRKRLIELTGETFALPPKFPDIYSHLLKTTPDPAMLLQQVQQIMMLRA